MGRFKEAFEYYTPPAVKAWIPYRARSHAEFAEVINREGVNEVHGIANKDKTNCSNTYSAGVLGDVRYQIIYTARSERGRKIKFRETIGTVFESDDSFDEGRKLRTMRLILTAEKRLSDLEE